MLNKLLAASAGLAILARNVTAQDEDNLAVIPDTALPEGGLGDEIPVGEELEASEGPNTDMEATSATEEGATEEGEEDGVKSHDDHEGHEGHEDHADHEEEHAHKYPISSSCLLKSATLGTFIPDSDTQFDNTNGITANLMTHHTPYEYYVCINQETSYLASLQLTFADEAGEDIVKLPLLGPASNEETEEDLYCGTFQFNDRGHATQVRIYQENQIVTGLGILYPELKDLVKIGKPTTDLLMIDIDDGQVLAGFYGSTLNNSNKITQLGVILQDTKCTKLDVDEKAAIQKLATKNAVTDEDDGNLVLIVVIIVVLIVIAVVIFLVIAFCRKRARKNKVEFFDSNQPPTNNNSQAMPDIATEDGLNTNRSGGKNTHRDLVNKIEV